MDITPMCGSPWLIAACHVLLRLLMPRHSPCALYSLTWRRTKCAFWFSQELCRPQIWFIVVFVLPLFKSPQIKTLLPLCCLLAISCLLHCSVFKVQLQPFSRSDRNAQTTVQTLRFELEKKWWAQVDSNHRPHDYQSCALAS